MLPVWRQTHRWHKGAHRNSVDDLSRGIYSALYGIVERELDKGLNRYSIMHCIVCGPAAGLQ